MSKRPFSAPSLIRAIAIAVGLFACDSDHGAREQRGAQADAVTSAPRESVAAAPPVQASRGRHDAIPCRAIAVDGDVRPEADGGLALATQAELESDDWLTLAPGARLVAKDPRTTRETTFRGPARVRTCVDAKEESWVASGTFESNVGAGESPGAEEWVVTPLGVVRFAAAKLAVQVFTHRRVRVPPPAGRAGDHIDHDAGAKPGASAREGVRIGIAEGVAFVWAASDASVRGLDAGTGSGDEGWVRISDSSALIDPNASHTPLEAARSALGSCEAFGKSARDLASALLSRAEGGLAQVAAKQFTERRLARAACAVAALRVEGIPAADDPAEKDGAERSLRDALALWHEVPVGP